MKTYIDKCQCDYILYKIREVVDADTGETKRVTDINNTILNADGEIVCCNCGTVSYKDLLKGFRGHIIEEIGGMVKEFRGKEKTLGNVYSSHKSINHIHKLVRVGEIYRGMIKKRTDSELIMNKNA